MVHRLKCAEVWGGIKNTDVDVCSSGMTVSLYSSSCDGGKGGDAYYFSVCGADRVSRLVLADVVGHGEQVSQISQWVYEQMTTRLDDPDLPGLLSELNNRVVTRGFQALTTAAVASYYVDLKQMYYCYAGHPPMLVRRGGERWREVPLRASETAGDANLPLGVSEDVRYDMSDVRLGTGDDLLLFSDGVLEARDDDGKLFGMDRLRAALQEAGDVEPMKIKSDVLNKLRAWTGGALRHDDVTLIAIRVA